MNASQRRRSQRNFSFVVKVSASHAEQYFQHDRKIKDAQSWCCKQFKKDAWRSMQYWDHSEFKFAKSSDAVLFSLRWA